MDDHERASTSVVAVRLCFRILSAKNIGLTITPSDITEQEVRLLELIEAERAEHFRTVAERSQMTCLSPLAPVPM
jgi:hypothetical protein